jgi:cytochrome c-type biogenesis protein CcmH
VAGTIAVAPSLASRAGGGVLFVIARSAADNKILAVRREDNVTFPFKFSISGRDAMIAGTAFAGPLTVTARLSKSGDAVAAKGDLEGTARGVAVGATDVKVTLDTVKE